jgi:branched-chain amino acid aminotransferase
MESTPYIWMDGKLIPWEEAQVHVLSHALHYGSGVFEGIRFYETPDGVAIFRLDDHTKRLFYSATVLEMQIPFTEEEINNATVEVVAKSGVGAPVNIIIACWPWGKYLADRPLRVKISDFMRIHPKSLVSDAKVTGHYVNSILASLEVRGEKYDEAILLDYEGNVAEGPGENLFLVRGGELITPPFGKILKGITRDSAMRIAKDLGISVKEETIRKEDLFTADELFFTGTAAEVSPIGFLNEEKIGTGEEGPITKKIREKYMEAVSGKAPEYRSWLTLVRE